MGTAKRIKRRQTNAHVAQVKADSRWLFWRCGTKGIETKHRTPDTAYSTSNPWLVLTKRRSTANTAASSKRKGVVFIYSASRPSHAKSSSHNLKGKHHATKRLRPIRKGTPCSDSLMKIKTFQTTKIKKSISVWDAHGRFCVIHPRHLATEPL